jgi:predicted ATPase
MITKLHATNYKSIARLDVELLALTTLVGPNGSGKSNVADVLRFLADCVNTSLGRAIAVRHGFRAICRWDTYGSHAVEIGIVVDTHEGSGMWLFRLGPSTNEDGFRVDGEYALWATRPKGMSVPVPAEAWDLNQPDAAIARAKTHSDTFWLCRYTGQLDYEAGAGAKTAGHILIDSANLALPHFVSHHRKELAPLEDELRRIAIYTPFPNTLRVPQNPNPTRMTSSGDNWASTLKSLNKATWGAELITALYHIVGDVDDYRVLQADGFLIPEFRHGVGARGRERWLGAAQESDGTLRLAAILTALFQEPSLSLIGFEEPELAVHPGAIPVLFDFLNEASTRSQILLTTHSPDLLDLLPVDDIRVVERHDGATSVSRVEERQRELVKRRWRSSSLTGSTRRGFCPVFI